MGFHGPTGESHAYPVPATQTQRSPLLAPRLTEFDLSGVGVGERLGLEVDEDVAFQPAVVEDQIDEIGGAADADLFLIGLEAEAVTRSRRRVRLTMGA
jgi:hypothetical protein